jgi:hypothetical protein
MFFRLKFSTRLSITFLSLAATNCLNANPPISEGLQVWLRSDQGVVLDDGKIRQWMDQSGKDHHFKQDEPDKRPKINEQAFPINRKQFFKVGEQSGEFGFPPKTMGWDFMVDEEVQVSEFSAFDFDGAGFTGTVTAQLLRRNDPQTPLTSGDDTPGAILETVSFSTSSPGELRGQHRVKSLPTPRLLSPGAYTLLAWGFDTNNPATRKKRLSAK